MVTPYVENVPGDLCETRRWPARARRRSIAAEMLVLLEENVPAQRRFRARRDFVRKLCRFGSRARPAGEGPSAEQMVREDRERRRQWS